MDANTIMLLVALIGILSLLAQGCVKTFLPQFASWFKRIRYSDCWGVHLDVDPEEPKRHRHGSHSPHRTPRPRTKQEDNENIAVKDEKQEAAQ